MIIGKTFKTQQVWGAQSPLRGTTGAGLKSLSGLSSSHTVIPKTGEAGMERTDHIKEADVLHAALFIQQTRSLLEGSLFSTPSPAFIACRLLDRSHSDWREMVGNF